MIFSSPTSDASQEVITTLTYHNITLLSMILSREILPLFLTSPEQKVLEGAATEVSCSRTNDAPSP